MATVNRKPTSPAAAASKRSTDLVVGDLLNVAIGGKLAYKNAELLGHNEVYLKVRGSLSIAPFTEIVMVPWSAIEGVGVVGQR